MDKRFRESSSEKIIHKMDGTKIDAKELKMIKVRISRKLPGSTETDEVDHTLEKLEDMRIYRRNGEGIHPIFARNGIVVNSEEEAIQQTEFNFSSLSTTTCMELKKIKVSIIRKLRGNIETDEVDRTLEKLEDMKIYRRKGEGRHPIFARSDIRKGRISSRRSSDNYANRSSRPHRRSPKREAATSRSNRNSSSPHIDSRPRNSRKDSSSRNRSRSRDSNRRSRSTSSRKDDRDRRMHERRNRPRSRDSNRKSRRSRSRSRSSRKESRRLSWSPDDRDRRMHERRNRPRSRDSNGKSRRSRSRFRSSRKESRRRSRSPDDRDRRFRSRERYRSPPRRRSRSRPPHMAAIDPATGTPVYIPPYFGHEGNPWLCPSIRPPMFLPGQPMPPRGMYRGPMPGIRPPLPYLPPYMSPFRQIRPQSSPSNLTQSEMALYKILHEKLQGTS